MCKFKVEVASSVWQAENGWPIFHATMSLSATISLHNHESRPAKFATDVLVAVRHVWNKCVELRPWMYNPGPEVTVDERLVPFRGIQYSFCWPREKNDLALYSISIYLWFIERVGQEKQLWVAIDSNCEAVYGPAQKCPGSYYKGLDYEQYIRIKI